MWKKGVLILLAFVVIVVGAGISYLFAYQPATAEPSGIQVEITPERVARGNYLFNHLFECVGCHSDRDFDRFNAPPKDGRIGVGLEFPAEMGLPGRVVAPNLTPDKETGIGEWTDGEVIRAIREGIGRDGRALFSFMPYRGYRNMSDEDVQSVVAYLRSLPPVRNELPKTQLALPVQLLGKFDPQPVSGVVQAPPKSDSVAYGKYLVRVGGCADCHTMKRQGKDIEEMDLAGGFELRFPSGVVVSANITPDEDTGIGRWTEDGFVSRFRQYQRFAREGAPKADRASFTIMPWLAYSELEEEDLRAIYRYLRTVPPVSHQVVLHPEAALASR
jgi:mono/diheme cytochrome c family protein